MPSLFPGMDPFIEGQRWGSFHDRLIVTLGDALVPQVRPRYVVDVEERAYLERSPEGAPPFLVPDVMVTDRERGEIAARGGVATTAASIEPVTLSVPIPHRERETFLTLRDRASHEVVTVIEALSPGNKRSGSDGRNEYLEKRRQVLLSSAHLVELDLLRGGQRLPTVESLPLGDYYAFVCRAGRRPWVDVYAWTLRQALPRLPVPLAEEDPDVWLDLQEVFDTVYDRGGYDYALDYTAPIVPPLSEADTEWARDQLAAAAAKADSG